jgi:hypothetical protein
MGLYFLIIMLNYSLFIHPPPFEREGGLFRPVEVTDGEGGAEERDLLGWSD